MRVSYCRSAAVHAVECLVAGRPRQWLRIETDPQVFYTRFYNHARRLRLEFLELEVPMVFFKPLLDPGGRSASELKWPLRNRFRSEIYTNQ